MLRKLLPAIAAVALACGSATTAPRLMTLDQIVGSWQLQNVDGRKLPWILQQQSNYTLTLTDYWINFATGSKYTQISYLTNVAQTPQGTQTLKSSSVDTYTFELSGSAVIENEFVGTVSTDGQTLTMLDINDHSHWVYRRGP
jgi:hypothetical protein